MSLPMFSEVRDIDIAITGAPMPIDAYSSIIREVQNLECKYLNSLDVDGVSQGLVDVTAIKTAITGKLNSQLYVFDLTTDFAGGVYTFAFIEKAPNVESATSL